MIFYIKVKDYGKIESFYITQNKDSDLSVKIQP